MGWQTRGLRAGKLRRNWSRLIHYAVAMGSHSPAGVVMQFFFAQRISCSGFLWQPLSWLFCEAPDPATMLMNRNLCATATCQLQIAEAKIFAEFLPNKSIRKYLASTTEKTSEVCPRNLNLLLFKPLRVCCARSFGFHLIFAIGFYPTICVLPLLTIRLVQGKAKHMLQEALRWRWLHFPQVKQVHLIRDRIVVTRTLIILGEEKTKR